MQVLIAPAAFKGSLSPLAVADAIRHGVAAADKDQQLTSVCAPLADGGDGTIEAVHATLGGKLIAQQVLNALGEPVNGHWLKLPDCAVVELACACGIGSLDKSRLDPLHAHTFGLGQMIARCIESGAENIVIGLGGSASTDGGMGALKALGAVFLDDSGEMDALGGGALAQVRAIDLTDTRQMLKGVTLTVLVDVDSPLLGPRGAAAVFGPQKGADADEVRQLEAGLNNFANVVEQSTGRMVRDLRGAGAAGGTAFGLAAALGAQITPGFDWIANATRLEDKVHAADLVITGEGRFDKQSLLGKGTGTLVTLCHQMNKPLLVISALPPDANYANVTIATVCESKAHCTSQDIAGTVSKSLPLLLNL